MVSPSESWPPIPGMAGTIETESYFKRIQESHPGQDLHGRFLRPGRIPLTFSRIGMGSYRLSEGVAVHQDALETAIHLGCNVVDMSPEYSSGRSMKLIGRVLRELIGLKVVRREELVLISGHNAGEDGDPAKLEESLDLGLKTPGLVALDGFIIRNPPATDFKKTREYLESAFAFLETKRLEGRIQYYGFSSQAVNDQPGQWHELIRSLTGEDQYPGFLMFGYPHNLIEMNLSRERALLDRDLRARGFWTFGYRPFLSRTQGMPLRLAGCNPPLDPTPYENEFLTLVQGLEKLERQIETETEFRFDSRFNAHSLLLSSFHWQMLPPENFHEMLPDLSENSQKLVDRIHVFEKNQNYSLRYASAVNRSFFLLDKLVRIGVCRRGETLLKAFQNVVPEASSAAGVTMGVLLGRHSPSTTFAGMRTRNQVTDILESAEQPIEDPVKLRSLQKLAEKFASTRRANRFLEKQPLTRPRITPDPEGIPP